MQIIIYLSTIIWLAPVIRNFNGNYRWVFIGLGLSDIICLSLFFMGAENPNWGVIIADSVIIILYNRKLLNSGYVIMNSIIYLGLILFISLFDITAHGIVLMLDLIIIGKSLKVIFDEILLEKKVNLFSFILTLNFLLIMLNTLFIIINPNMGVGYFYSTLILLMIFAVFFTIFSDTSKALIWDLKKIKRQSNGN